MAKTAKKMLEFGLAEIRAGHWCKGTIAVLGTCKDEWSGRRTTVNDDLLRVGVGEVELPGFRKTKDQGCALGLVSMAAGLGKTVKVVSGSRTIELFLPDWPSSGLARADEATKAAVTKALRCLASTVPPRRLHAVHPVLPTYQADELRIETAGVEALEGIIYNYNDASDTSRRKAIAWFEAAIEKARR